MRSRIREAKSRNENRNENQPQDSPGSDGVDCLVLPTFASGADNPDPKSASGNWLTWRMAI